MKKLFAILVSAMLVFSLAACGGGTSSTPPASEPASTPASTPASEPASEPTDVAPENLTLNVWVGGGDNMRTLYEAWIEDFNSNAEYNPHGITAKLQFMPSGAGNQSITDRYFAAYQAGEKDTDFDIIEFGDDGISRTMNEIGTESFTKLDFSKIANYANMSARPAEGEEYFMPYRGTTVLMAYNSEKVPNPPKTVDELTQWIKDNPGRFSYNATGTGGAGTSFAQTMVYNFLPAEALMSSDTKWEAEWDEGFEYLAEIHPFLYQSGGRTVYPNKNQGTLDLLADGEIDMCPAWADQTITQTLAGTLPATTKMYQIDPSLTGAVNCLGVPSIGSNVEGAYYFMNYVLSPEAQAKQVELIAAIPLVPVEGGGDAAEMVKDLDVSAFRTISLGELGNRFTEVWEEKIASL